MPATCIAHAPEVMKIKLCSKIHRHNLSLPTYSAAQEQEASLKTVQYNYTYYYWPEDHKLGIITKCNIIILDTMAKLILYCRWEIYNSTMNIIIIFMIREFRIDIIVQVEVAI